MAQGEYSDAQLAPLTFAVQSFLTDEAGAAVRCGVDGRRDWGRVEQGVGGMDRSPVTGREAGREGQTYTAPRCACLYHGRKS